MTTKVLTDEEVKNMLGPIHAAYIQAVNMNEKNRDMLEKQHIEDGYLLERCLSILYSCALKHPSLEIERNELIKDIRTRLGPYKGAL